MTDRNDASRVDPAPAVDRSRSNHVDTNTLATSAPSPVSGEPDVRQTKERFAAILAQIDALEAAGNICESQDLRRDVWWVKESFEVSRRNERLFRDRYDFWLSIARDAAQTLGLPPDGPATDLAPALASLLSDRERLTRALREIAETRDAPDIPSAHEDCCIIADQALQSMASLPPTPSDRE